MSPYCFGLSVRAVIWLWFSHTHITALVVKCVSVHKSCHVRAIVQRDTEYQLCNLFFWCFFFFLADWLQEYVRQLFPCFSFCSFPQTLSQSMLDFKNTFRLISTIMTYSNVSHQVCWLHISRIQLVWVIGLCGNRKAFSPMNVWSPVFKLKPNESFGHLDQSLASFA